MKKEELFFWEAIENSYQYDKSDWQAYDIDEHLEYLTDYLAQYDEETLISFERTLQEKLLDLYNSQIADLYTILHADFKKKGETYFFEDEPYISTDGFIYFRCWLLLKGKEFFDDINRDLNAFISGKYHFNIGDTWGEGLLYVSDEAYLQDNEDDEETPISDAVYEAYSGIHYDNDREMEGIPSRGEELFQKYPELVKEMCDLR